MLCGDLTRPATTVDHNMSESERHKERRTSWKPHWLALPGERWKAAKRSRRYVKSGGLKPDVMAARIPPRRT